MAEDNSNEPEKGVPAELNQDRFVGGQDLTRWHAPLGQGLAKLMHWIALRVGAHVALIITLLVGGVIAVGLTTLFAGIYDAVTEADGVAGLDHPLLDYAETIRSPWLNGAVTEYTNIGGTIGMPILAITVMVILALRRRSWTPAILIGAAGIGSLLMTIAGKQLFGRSRPSLSDAVPPFEYSPSFPSGHSLNSFVIAGIVAYIIVLRRKTATGRVITISVAALFALSIGLSRVYLGHHWFTDVLGAWVLGAAWLAIVITAHRLYLTSRKHGSRDRPVVSARRISARG